MTATGQYRDTPRAWFENEGFGFEVVHSGGAWSVRIKPFYMFTGQDARTPLSPWARAARSTRRFKLDRNKNVEDDLTFWSRYLSRNAEAMHLGFEHVGDLILAGRFLGDSAPDCVIVCLPETLADLRMENPGLSAEERQALEQLRREEESDQMALFSATPDEIKAAEELRSQAEDLLFRTFYRALKARSQNHRNAVPIQILRRDTIDRPDDKGHSYATRCWNLAASLYYKAGGVPWRPVDLPENVCFVGLSFHHLKKRTGSLVYASVVQAFSNDVEPFTLKGASIDHNQREDPHDIGTDQRLALLDGIRDGLDLAGEIGRRFAQDVRSKIQRLPLAIDQRLKHASLIAGYEADHHGGSAAGTNSHFSYESWGLTCRQHLQPDRHYHAQRKNTDHLAGLVQLFVGN